ncbi:hypothetical protein RND81_11G106000 [Saponaria officinalis]|uniref:C2H2-type domain-containing protein n=1 Tax=Saponaria officinalis TaxID=3572 RepID=A0AAW1HJG8_SAPOF
MGDQEANSNGFVVEIPTINGSIDPPPKKKRNLPGNPDPEAEVIALSPKTLMTTNRFLCEICGKGFQRDQNLQLHRRGHNLPWKLKQRTSKEPRKRVYICPEKTCVHNHPSRALGDLTGIKKHFFRKHGEKKWKCEKCNKKYAVQSDWKAHSKTCGTREYKCDCGTIFSRRDSFITHRAFCDALAEETARMNAANAHFSLNSIGTLNNNNNLNYHFVGSNNPTSPAIAMSQHFSSIFKPLSSTTKDETLDLHNQRPLNLPLWLGNHTLHGPTNNNNSNNINNNVSIHDNNNNNNNFIMHHQLINPTFNPFNFQNTPIMLVPGSNPPPNSNGYSQSNWVLGGKTTPNTQLNNNNGGELGLITNNIPSNTSSIPCLYSTQQIQTQTCSTSNSSHFMSATALLQKAAQIGATSTTTTNDALFLGSFGLMKENNNININNNNTNNYNNGHGHGDGSVYGTSNSTTTNFESDLEGSGSVDDLSTMTTLYNPSKRQKLHEDLQDNNYVGGVGVGGQTRDFLGVSSQTSCHPASVNGWV